VEAQIGREWLTMMTSLDKNILLASPDQIGTRDGIKPLTSNCEYPEFLLPLLCELISLAAFRGEDSFTPVHQSRIDDPDWDMSVTQCSNNLEMSCVRHTSLTLSTLETRDTHVWTFAGAEVDGVIPAPASTPCSNTEISHHSTLADEGQQY